MGELPTGTVTLVFTDIEGSTRLLQHLGSDYDEALQDHRRILRDAFSSCGGVEVDTQGDAFFVAFPRAAGAVEAVARAQRALGEHGWPQQEELRVRMGVHTGEPRVSREGYVGDDVHKGARICAAAHGGQVLISDATARLLPGRLEGYRLRDLGKHCLKDLTGRERLYQLVVEGLRSDFPPIRTLDARPHNLPRQLSPLIGREHELGQVRSLLRRDDVAVVTLTGPGGTGKTSLALAVAAEARDDFSDGVFFVDLSSLTDPALVVPTIAQVLSLKESPGTTITDVLTEYLSGRELLLVLDNFEQVVAGAPEISSLVSSAPRLRLLVTSREALRVAGEREFPVAPLPLPANQAPLDELVEAPAVALFAARAEASKPGFEVTRDNAVHVADICRRLDGLPLAIELAAARIKVLPLPALSQRLEQGLKVLTSGRRDATERQRTLRGAIAWSYDLLSQDEQTLFRRLGAFVGGWTFDASEIVCDLGDLRLDVLDGLVSLVDKSLVRAVGEDDEARFSMLEMIREFASEGLEDSGEAEHIRRAHAEFFRALAEQAEPNLLRRDQKHWLDRLEAEHDNIRAALDWTLQDSPADGIGIVSGLVRFWDTRGYVTEGRQWLSRLIDCKELGTRERMRATLAAAMLAELQDDYGNAATYGQEALSLARELGSAVDAARALIGLGWVSYRQGDLEGASLAIEEALAVSERAGDPYLVGRALSSLAAVRSDQQRNDAAIALYQRSAEIAERSGDRRGAMTVLVNLGELQAFASNFEDAQKSLRRALALAEELDDPLHEAGALANLGLVALLERRPRDGIGALERALSVANRIGSTYLALGAVDGLAAAVADEDPVTAARLFVASDVLRERVGVPRSSGEAGLYQPWIDGLKDVLTHEDAAEVSHQVRDLADVVSLVRDEVGFSRPQPA